MTKIKITKSCGNVFKDIGCEDADELFEAAESISSNMPRPMAWDEAVKEVHTACKRKRKSLNLKKGAKLPKMTAIWLDPHVYEELNKMAKLQNVTVGELITKYFTEDFVKKLKEKK